MEGGRLSIVDCLLSRSWIAILELLEPTSRQGGCLQLPHLVASINDPRSAMQVTVCTKEARSWYQPLLRRTAAMRTSGRKEWEQKEAGGQPDGERSGKGRLIDGEKSG